jgi:hypothetical protein
VRDEGHARAGGGQRPGFVAAVTTTEARGGATVEGGQARDGGHARTDGGWRLGFVTAVTTTEARGGVVVEAQRATAVEQCPPSLTLRRNRRRRRSSLDGGPLLRQPNDGEHGSGRSDNLLLARRR